MLGGRSGDLVDLRRLGECLGDSRWSFRRLGLGELVDVEETWWMFRIIGTFFSRTVGHSRDLVEVQDTRWTFRILGERLGDLVDVEEL